MECNSRLNRKIYMTGESFLAAFNWHSHVKTHTIGDTKIFLEIIWRLDKTIWMCAQGHLLSQCTSPNYHIWQANRWRARVVKPWIWIITFLHVIKYRKVQYNKNHNCVTPYARNRYTPYHRPGQIVGESDEWKWTNEQSVMRSSVLNTLIVELKKCVRLLILEKKENKK